MVSEMKLIKLLLERKSRIEQIKQTEADLRELHKSEPMSLQTRIKASILCFLDREKHEIDKKIETELEDRDQYNNQQEVRR